MNNNFNQFTKWKNTNKSGMVLSNWFKADNEVIRSIISETTPQTCMLYLIILSHRNSKTNKCFPSISLLAREMGRSARTIQRMIDDLQDMGALRINSGKMGVSNNYYFPMESFFKEDASTAMARKRTDGFTKTSITKKSEEISCDVPVQDSDGQIPDWDEDDFPFA